MDVNAVLGILLAIAVIAILLLALQVGPARASSNKALKEVEALKARLADSETEGRRHLDALAAKRRETDELKDRVRDAKKKRQEEREMEKFQRDLTKARQEIEVEMERKLSQAREEAEEARSIAKKLSVELEGLRSKRPMAVVAPIGEAPAAPQERKPREPRPEELVRLEVAEKDLKEAREKAREFDAEVKRQKGRAETDRRVLLIQKKEIELAKDKYRALETKHNALIHERDDLRLSLYELEKEMKALLPTAPADERSAAAKAEPAESVKQAELSESIGPSEAAESVEPTDHTAEIAARSAESKA